uniref:CUB domain-containing protein n=1 Tax=Steinernema glaseri TaxID=37863 RepID=A0A1I8AVW4_9BILA
MNPFWTSSARQWMSLLRDLHTLLFVAVKGWTSPTTISCQHGGLKIKGHEKTCIPNSYDRDLVCNITIPSARAFG